MKVSPKELKATSREFRGAAKQSDALVDHLDAQVRRLVEAWPEAGGYAFMEQYRDWRQHVASISVALIAISDELEAAAERIVDVMN